MRKVIYFIKSLQDFFLQPNKQDLTYKYIAFLCTQVKNPHEDDYKTLGQVIKYVEETIHLLLVIGADGSGNLVWNIDTAFAVHPNCKSHTGAVLMMRHGAVISISSEQKINTNRLTEAELVGVDDAMTFVM